MIHHITFAMLDGKFPKSNTIAMCQHYMERLLSDPDLSYTDRRTAIDYIYAHRHRFTALPTDTGHFVQDEINRKLNGNNVVEDFFEWLQEGVWKSNNR